MTFFAWWWAPQLLAPYSRVGPMWGLRWIQVDQKEGYACPFLGHTDSSPHLCVNGSGPSWVLPSFFPTTFPCICSAPFFFLSSYSFPSSIPYSPSPPSPAFKSPKGMLGGIWGWEGRRLGGLKRSNSVGDHCQAQILDQWRNCLGRKGDAKERIQNKKDNPMYNSNGGPQCVKLQSQ